MKRQRKIHLDLPARECDYCHKPYRPARHKQRFCSKPRRCHVEHHNKRLRAALKLLASGIKLS
jgi:hypothetical protein